MIDREKVINGLHEMSCRATWKDIDQIRHRFQPIINDALAMLKEQPEIVLCGECKYYREGFCYNPNTFVTTCGNTVPDWYCADGRRK